MVPFRYHLDTRNDIRNQRVMKRKTVSPNQFKRYSRLLSDWLKSIIFQVVNVEQIRQKHGR